MQWLQQAQKLQQQAADFILISILASHGSTPRKEGTKMIVCLEQQFGSIGGGKLEWEASQLALQMLKEKQKQKIKTYHLGASLGQCCGGKVLVLLEGFFFEKKLLAIFGAGHIAKALIPMLIPVLQPLGYKIMLLDNRKKILEQITGELQKNFCDYPQDEIASMPANGYYLVMTHEHNLDLAIAEQVLKKNNFSFLGIVGSQKKALRFQKLLTQKGYKKELVNSIYCPIGLDLGKTNQPSHIAISIIAQLIKKILLENNEKKTFLKKEKSV